MPRADTARSGADPAPASPPAATRAAARYWTVVTSHFIIDLYPMFFVALVAALQARLGLTELQAALIISFNGVISGITQPISAWVGDRLNTRVFGWLGLAAAGLAVSSIGWAQNYTQLLALQIIGMTGVGVFHPIASALAGRLGRDGLHSRFGGRSARGMALAIFFAAGVGAGGFAGPLIATRINAVGPNGMQWLSVMAVPGVIGAAALWIATRRVPHREAAHLSRADGALSSVASERARWFAVGLLYISNALRFTVNLGLFYLYKRWAETQLAADASAAAVSNLHAEILAVSQIGMGISAIVIGRRLAPGRERGLMISTGLVTAPFIALMPVLDGWMMLAAASVVAFGFFGVIPTSISLAQRLLPHATGLTAGILMGGGWAVAAGGPVLAERVADAFGLDIAFLLFAGFMAAAGGVSALLSRRLIRAAATLA